MNFGLLAIVLVTTFVFQLVTLLYCASIYPATRQAAGLIIAVYDDRTDLPFHPGDSVRAARPSLEDLRTCYPVLAEELARYPRALIQRIQLRKIILCSELTLNGKEVAGLTHGAAGLVVLNVRPPGHREFEARRWAIHHELFHVIDRAVLSTPRANEAWSGLNPAGFKYGGQEILDALKITGESPGQPPETPGFLDYYGMVSPEEDRAEIFACLMVSPNRLEAIAAGDGVLSAKRSMIKRLLHRLDQEFASSVK